MIPTPTKPIPSPRALVLAAESWYRASPRPCIPEPSCTMVRVAAAWSAAIRMVLAPESSEFATVSVRMVLPLQVAQLQLT